MILVLAAVAEELGPLPGRTVGVGPVVAAASTARILCELRPDAVVLIGTAGSYRGGPPVGQACAARRVGLADGAATMGLGYVPRPPPPLPCDPRLLARAGVPAVDVLNTGAITTDPVLAARLADGWQVEHLEAYGVAAACAAAQVPFVALLGIANQVGPDAHAQWLTHRNAAQDSAREAANALIAGEPMLGR
ncbi:futalosine hydrolase [Myxococcota bacterium]|nr:futalosine hydrolase [Myxococcota bacterium]